MNPLNINNLFSQNCIFMEIVELKSALTKICQWDCLEFRHVCFREAYEGFQGRVCLVIGFFITIDFHSLLPLSGPSTIYSLGQ